MPAAGELCHFGHAYGVVVERSAEGGAASELPQAAVEPLGSAELAVAVFAGDAALLDVGDQDAAGVDCFHYGGHGVVLPAHHHPECSRMGFVQRCLDALCGLAYGDVACGSTLLKDFHVVYGRVAVELVLMAVEGCCEGCEVGVAGVDPAGAGEAVPVSLGDDVSAGMEGGEVCGDDAVVAGQDWGDAEFAEHCDEFLC